MEQLDEGQSAVTLGGLFAEMALSLRPVVLPDGAADRAVSWVHATEQLDPRPHVRDGELICTLGSALLAEGSHLAFVDAVRDGGAVGICLGLGEVHLVAPPELVDACFRLSMPLMVLSHGIPFMALNEHVLAHRTLALSAQVQQETSLIAELLELARGGPDANALLERAAAQSSGRYSRSGTGNLSWNGAGSGPSAEFLAQLTSVLELSEREHERHLSEREERLGQLVRLLVDGLAHPAALRPELEIDGLDPSELRVSCWPVGAQRLLRETGIAGLIALANREVLLVSGAEADIAGLSERIGLIGGYSSEVQLADLGRAVSEARAALRIARRRGAVTGPEYLTSFEALLEQQPAGRLAPFVDRLIAPIAASGPKVGPELVHTLRAFLASGSAVQATSERLALHPNTIRHRLARIALLSGRDPLDPSQAVDLRVAMWAWERQRRNLERMIRPLD